MRDILVTCLVLGSLPMIVVRPWIGILVFSWLSYMSPHRLTFGFAYFMPFAMVVALVTVFACFLSKEENRRIPMTAITGLLFGYIAWTCVTTFFALVPESAYDQWIKFMKIQIIVVLTLYIINDRFRLNWLIWVMAASISFYGVRGGVFALLTGGGDRVFGPTGSFIEDNNQLALALVMTIPLLYYMYFHVSEIRVTFMSEKWIKRCVLAVLGLTVLATIATYSRGGFLALSVMGVVWWWRGRHKMLLGSLGVVGLVVVLVMMPQHWWDRMASIQNYQEDRSVGDRFYAWLFSYNVAVDHPITAGGFKVHNSEQLYKKYSPNAFRTATAHSIYFEVLGEHGFIGLALFLTLGGTALITCGRMRRRTRDRPDLRWAFDLFSMMQVSLIGYACAGAFLNLATFDYYYHMLAVVVIAREIALKALREKPPEAAETAVAAAQAPAMLRRRRAAGALAPPGATLGGASGFLIKRR